MLNVHSHTFIHPITNMYLHTSFFIFFFFVYSYVLNIVIIENTDDISKRQNNISDLIIIMGKKTEKSHCIG